MTFEIPQDIILCHEEKKGRAFLRKIWGKKGTFVCTIGNSETGKIPGISAAGAVPEITDFTPAADVELLYFGWCKCINGVPVTPTGIPTPGLITVSATRLGKMPIFAVAGGVNVRPNAPFFDLDGKAVCFGAAIAARQLAHNLLWFCVIADDANVQGSVIIEDPD